MTSKEAAAQIEQCEARLQNDYALLIQKASQMGRDAYHTALKKKMIWAGVIAVAVFLIVWLLLRWGFFAGLIVGIIAGVIYMAIGHSAELDSIEQTNKAFQEALNKYSSI